MCYNGQLVLELGIEEVSKNSAMIAKIKRLWAARREIHSMSAFARPWWPIITAEAPEEVVEMQWGLIPVWAKDPAEFLKKSPTFNAISEEAYRKPSFRSAWKMGRRCLIPMTGFYEWHHHGEGKKKLTYPHFIHLKSTPVMFMAGLYENGTFTLLTTEANSMMAWVHNVKKRMPVIISPGEEEMWLKAGLTEEKARLMCKPYPDEDMEAWPISRRITSRTEDPNVPQVSERHEYPELQPPAQELF
jgi:putative SOS response-associated peptidase YedK